MLVREPVQGFDLRIGHLATQNDIGILERFGPPVLPARFTYVCTRTKALQPSTSMPPTADECTVLRPRLPMLLPRAEAVGVADALIEA